MSTRSNIAIQLPEDKDGNKKIKVIYVHSDGYPYGIGKILNDNYNTYDKARELFNFGDASYLDDTIESCSFYGRDWDRKEDPAKTYRDEWMYMYDMRGDSHIEYIYLFKDNRWHVSTQHYIDSKKIKDIYDDSGLWYQGKFEPLSLNKEYIKYAGKHEKHAEAKMVAQLGSFLSSKFPTDSIEMQGAAMKKKSN